MFDVQIDGAWHQFPKGTRVIEACAQAGVFVPRYCYHKKLSSPGNCRMCLIEMGMPKIGPDRKECAMREIDDAAEREDQRQAKRDQKIVDAVKQPVEDLLR